MRIQIRKTVYQDIVNLRELFELGRQKQIATGNPNQWQKGYPDEALLHQDIASGGSYVCVCDDEIVGSFYLLHGAEPTYQEMKAGQWLNDLPYVTIHRFVTKYDRQGIAIQCLKWIMNDDTNIKIDTHERNLPMRQLIEKLGFKYCGIINLSNGDERVAYQYFVSKEGAV